MALAPAYHESLPYIDPEPSPEALAAARALIADEQSATSPPPTTTPKPTSFTPALTAELSRIAASTPSTPLDLSRYEAPSAPPPHSSPTLIAESLSRAAASGAYLSSRAQSLRLLDAWGRNAWLLGNHELEAELRALEAKLAAARAEVDVVNLQRRRRQEDASGEMEALEGAWRRGVGRALETEVAVEELRREIREELRRKGALEVPAQ